MLTHQAAACNDEQSQAACVEALAAALSDTVCASYCRFWHDERRFKGGADKCLVQQALFAAGEL
jgi:hypothetical protein